MSHQALRNPKWALIWTLLIGAFCVLDAWRNSKHDASTFTDVNRDIRKLSPDMFDRALGAAPSFFLRHLAKEVVRDLISE